MRRPLALSLAVFLLALPAAADAATRCVPATGAGCDSSHPTIEAAVTAANPGDTIRIAAGTYSESIFATKQLHFVGAGGGTLDSLGATVIQGSTPLSLSAGGSIRSIRAIATNSSLGNDAIRISPPVSGTYSYSLDDVVGLGGTSSSEQNTGRGLSVDAVAGIAISVAVSGGGFQTGASGSGSAVPAVSLNGPQITASFTATTLRGQGREGGFRATGSGTASITSSSVSGVIAAEVNNGTLDVRRSRLEGTDTNSGGFTRGLLLSESTSSTPTTATVTDSLVTATASMASTQAHAASVEVAAAGESASLVARGSTFLARGTDPDAGVRVTQAGAPAGSADLRNSVARIEGAAEAGEGDLVATRGSISAAHSSFSSRFEETGGTATEPGSGTNLAGDPLLAADFSLLPGSPLVDRGDPSLVTPGQLDLAGAARSLDGNGDCHAQPDIGAFERPDACPPNVAPQFLAASMLRKVFAPTSKSGKISAKRKRRVKRGTRFRYTLSEPARVEIRVERALAGRRAGRRCVKPTRRNRKRRRCTRYVRATTLRANEQAGRQSTAFTGRVRRKALKRGRYRARLVAIDPQGARSRERRLAFRIVKP